MKLLARIRVVALVDGVVCRFDSKGPKSKATNYVVAGTLARGHARGFVLDVLNGSEPKEKHHCQGYERSGGDSCSTSSILHS